MSARAAETHRSAHPAAAASERLKFPGDHNEQVAVLRARGKSLVRGRGHRCPGRLGRLLASRSLDLPEDWWGKSSTCFLSQERFGVRLEQETSFKLIVLLLGCPFTLESSCWVYGEETSSGPFLFEWFFIHSIYCLSSSQMVHTIFA